MSRKNDKTNVMRLLEQHGIEYESLCYKETGMIAGDDVARALGEDPTLVFKTLVTVGKSGGHYVFLVPVSGELDLKKGAKAAGEKYIEMIKSRELLPLTGYIHGGCSPIGMKKQFPTFVDASARDMDFIYFSGGRIGYQVRVSPKDLGKIVPVEFAELV
ncbi:MAG: Cys-tRNA(Pro) deacylase [Clostridiales bacterium]|nr:Cys-tRNA(Pro) deacylase [Clostridiales bacterium]MDD7035226.1 Cys-tRNA(Pro) deacylase [Bacillota bacterium]